MVIYTIIWTIVVIYAINTYFYLVEYDWKTTDEEDIQTYGIIQVIGIAVSGVVGGLVLMKYLDDRCKKQEDKK